MENKSKKIISIVLTMSLILVIIGVTYAAFIYSKEGTKENKVTTGKINFVYNETTNGIEISNALPMEDDEGKLIKETDENASRGYFDFNVEATLGGNTTIPYYVYAVDTIGGADATSNVTKTLSTSTTIPDGKRYTFTLKDFKVQGLLAMNVNEGAVTDATGNQNISTPITTGITIKTNDTTPPVCSVSSTTSASTESDPVIINIDCTDDSGVVKTNDISKEDVYFTGGYCSDSGVPFYDTISYQTSSINNGVRISVTINPIAMDMFNSFFSISSWGCTGTAYNLHLLSGTVTDINGNENVQLDYNFISLIPHKYCGGENCGGGTE